MPIYEYRCKSCGHDVEALQKVSDPPLKKCPDCGKRTLVRLMSAPSFRLKGGGWYETDFKSDNEKKRNLVDSGDGGKESAKEGGDSGKEKEAAPAKEAAKESTKTTLIPKAKTPAPKGVTKVAAKASGKAKTAKRASGTAKKPARAAAR